MAENTDKLLVLGAAIIAGYLLYSYTKSPEIILNSNTLAPTQPTNAVNQQQLENNNSEKLSSSNTNPPIQQPLNQPPTKEETKNVIDSSGVSAAIGGVGAAAFGIYQNRDTIINSGKKLFYKEKQEGDLNPLMNMNVGKGNRDNTEYITEN